MKMTLHSILNQKGECHGLSKPQAQNGDSVEKVDGHRDPSGPYWAKYYCSTPHVYQRAIAQGEPLSIGTLKTITFGNETK
jgi:hypothetical protein